MAEKLNPHWIFSHRKRKKYKIMKQKQEKEKIDFIKFQVVFLS